MRRLIPLTVLALLLAFVPTGASADCPACAQRAAEYWGAVVADAKATTPALADWLAHNEVTHGKSEAGNTYYLTPDCGMTPGQLEETLDIAKANKIHMTIFLMGVMIDKWPDESRALLKRAIDEGHELALHSYSHRNFRDLSSEEITDELVRNWALIDWALGYHYPIRFFRFPYGARNPELLQQVGALGIRSVFWDIDSLGWRDFATVPIVITQVTSKIRPGAVVIFHCSAVSDRGALAQYVTQLREQGLEPALLGASYPRPTASDLVGYPKPRPTPKPEVVEAPAATEPLTATTAVTGTATAPTPAPAPTSAPTPHPTPTPVPAAPQRETPGERRLERMLDMDFNTL
ncbi:MAG: polysaccharide deacetylase family protein [Chloroflexi bacterium]|nr:polysaccharide deacetylase family protein [Chloroflexota bacterium]